MDIWSLGFVTMQMLQIGSLSKPEDGVAHGATWCESIEKRAVETSLLSAKIQQRSSGPLLPALVTELWSFLANFMLKVDPKKRASAKDCLEAGRLTVFKSCNTTDGVATETAPRTSQLRNTITGIHAGPSVAAASSQHVNHQRNNSIPLKRSGFPSTVNARRKPSISDPAVEDSTDESTTALPKAATNPANDSHGQTPNIAHLNQMKTKYGKVLMDYMKS